MSRHPRPAHLFTCVSPHSPRADKAQRSELLRLGAAHTCVWDMRRSRTSEVHGESEARAARLGMQCSPLKMTTMAHWRGFAVGFLMQISSPGRNSSPSRPARKILCSLVSSYHPIAAAARDTHA